MIEGAQTIGAILTKVGIVPNVPSVFSSNLGSLKEALTQAREICWDWETNGKNPHVARPMGVGVYIPQTNRAWYVNIWHSVHNPKMPNHDEAAVARVLNGFFGNSRNHAIGHNVLYDMRINARIGVQHRCSISDSMILYHRTNENIAKSAEPEELASFGSMKPIGYGLKALTLVTFKEKAISLEDLTGGDQTTENTDPEEVGGYCMMDCINTWRIYCHAMQTLETDPVSLRLAGLDLINILPLHRMLQNGIPADVKEARSQADLYRRHYEDCTAAIYERLGYSPNLETHSGITQVLASLGCLPPDPKVERARLWNEASLTHDRKQARKLLDQMEDLETDGPLARSQLVQQIKRTPDKNKKEILALLIAREVGKQRLSRFLEPLLQKHIFPDERVYISSFLSLTTTTRFTCQPNFQSLPKKADKPGINKVWLDQLPGPLKLELKTRKIIAATSGNVLVAFDLSNAEPRYAAQRMENSLQDRGRRLDALRKEAWAKSRVRYPDLFEWANKCRIRAPNPIPPIDYPAMLHDSLWGAFQANQDPYNHISSIVGVSRDVAKQLWLSVIYGVSADTVAQNISSQQDVRCSPDQASIYIDQLFQAFPMLKVIQEETHREVLATGMIQTLLGRPRCRVPISMSPINVPKSRIQRPRYPAYAHMRLPRLLSYPPAI